MCLIDKFAWRKLTELLNTIFKEVLKAFMLTISRLSNLILFHRWRDNLNAFAYINISLLRFLI